MTLSDIATALHEAHVSGKSWQVCQRYCTASASFCCQAGEGGPAPQTVKSAVPNYPFALDIESGKTSHLAKIWNYFRALRTHGFA